MLVGTPTLITPVVAQPETSGGKFFCGQSRGAPTTMANSSQGPVPVIQYVSTMGTDEYAGSPLSDHFPTLSNVFMLRVR
jgi:hypothetical protein